MRSFRRNPDVNRDLAAFLALRWTEFGPPFDDRDGFRALVREFYGHEYRDSFNIPRDQEIAEEIIAAVSAIDHHVFLPPLPPVTLRVNHNFGLNARSAPQRILIMERIVGEGLVPQPHGLGVGSESPSAVFALVDDPERGRERRHNPYHGWVTADLPHSEYPWERQAQPGSVVVLHAIPPEYIVGVNGCPVDELIAAGKRWGLLAPYSVR